MNWEPGDHVIWCSAPRDGTQSKRFKRYKAVVTRVHKTKIEIEVVNPIGEKVLRWVNQKDLHK